ncbi:MAG: DUF819 family protein, partial [Calditrichaeota bacterium]|nr:DUF819 family protein [Calditrichota bacterium]
VSIFAPDIVGGEGPNAVWRGFTTIAGSWIGGSANQTAMKQVFEVGDRIFPIMVAVDVLVGYVWMGFLLYGAGMSRRIDRWLKADASAIDEVQEKIESYQASIARIPSLADLVTIAAVGFGVTA